MNQNFNPKISRRRWTVGRGPVGLFMFEKRVAITGFGGLTCKTTYTDLGGEIWRGQLPWSYQVRGMGC